MMYGEKIPHSTWKVAIYVRHDLVDFIHATVLLFISDPDHYIDTMIRIKNYNSRDVSSADVEYTFRWWTNLTRSAVQLDNFPAHACEVASYHQPH